MDLRRHFIKKQKETDQSLINEALEVVDSPLTIKGFVTIETYKGGELIRQSVEQENLVMLGSNTGISLLLQRLIGTNTYTANITHADIGTGTTAPVITDTQLQTAVARAVRSSESVSGNQANLAFFFADALLANGTYHEFGTFVDGTIAINTGKIFNRLILDTPYVKASGEDTTIRVRFTIT